MPETEAERKKQVVALIAFAAIAVISLLVAFVAIERTPSDEVAKSFSPDEIGEIAREELPDLEGIPQFGYTLGESHSPVGIGVFVDATCRECAPFFEELLPRLLPMIRNDELSANLEYVTDGSPASWLIAGVALELSNTGHLWDFIALHQALLARGATSNPTDMYLHVVTRAIPRLGGESPLNESPEHVHGGVELEMLLESANSQAAGYGLGDSDFGMVMKAGTAPEKVIVASTAELSTDQDRIFNRIDRAVRRIAHQANTAP